KEIFDKEPNATVEPFRTTQEAFDHPQVRHNGHVVQVGDTEQVGPIGNLPLTPGTPGGPPAAPVPAASIAWPAQTPAPIVDSPEALAEAPLTGVTIVDFATYYAAPFGTAILADLGARVIKVEPPEGEYSRYVAGRMLTHKT